MPWLYFWPIPADGVDPMNNSTVSGYPTRLLRGVELIAEARAKFNVPSENWTYPTKHYLGTPGDRYYAEIWVDGMDWQNSYWIIETANFGEPVCLPFIIFEDSKNQNLFNSCDFSTLIEATLYERRDHLWIQKDDGHFYDTIWAYFHRVRPDVYLERTPGMALYWVAHASQPRVQFYMNEKILPPYARFQESIGNHD